MFALAHAWTYISVFCAQVPEYLVHWQGYLHTENTWEPEANLEHNILLRIFLERCDSARAVGGCGTLPAPGVLSSARTRVKTCCCGAIGAEITADP